MIWPVSLCGDPYDSNDLEKANENHPQLPDPTNLGWTRDPESNQYAPVRCINPPAPDAVLYLIKCGCKRECEARCSCRKNNIPCTELCGCWDMSCNNKPVRSNQDFNE